MIKPILFNTEMVQAILDGRKTVTRRVAKFKPGPNPKFLGYAPNRSVAKAPYNPGDILYVRETWRIRNMMGDYADDTRRAEIEYKAGGDPITIPVLYSQEFEEWRTGAKWHPSIHMPKAAARLFLRVKSVRVERLQDITEEQARAEGCYHGPLFVGGEEDVVKALWSFSDVWKETIKRKDEDTYGWAANPWVWVIEFERISKEEAIGGRDHA